MSDPVENNQNELHEDLPVDSHEDVPSASPSEPEAAVTDNFEAKYQETYDQYVRLFAEFDNYKKRAVKERLDFVKTAAADVVSAILPVLDDFSRAAKSIETATEITPVKEGVDLIHKKLWKALADKGLEELNPSVGEAFDADVHEAITQIPAPDESLKNKIVDVVEKGFILHGKILRYPKVVVGA
jgi:molecular chaperone GrpE